MIKILCLIVLAELFGTCMHILFKKSANSLPDSQQKNLKDYFLFFKSILKLPTIWLGLLSVICGMTIWLTVLAQLDLSIAFPLDSIQYIMILAASYLFFKEEINWKRILGTGFIIIGIIIVAFSKG